MKRDSFGIMLIYLYVDDLLTAGSTLDLVLLVKNKLFKRFEMADCDDAKICFGPGIALDRSKHRLKVCQPINAFEIFERFERQDCKPASIPMEGQINLEVLSNESFCSTNYCQAIGSLMYLVIFTRPNFAFSAGRLL